MTINHAFNRASAAASEAKEAFKKLDSDDPRIQCVAFGVALLGANEGDPLAMYSVAYALRVGKGVEINEESSLYWLHRSAMHPQAPSISLYSYGLLHLERRCSAADPVTGLRLLALAVAKGHLAARKRLLAECDKGEFMQDARKIAFNVLSQMIDVPCPNPYHVDAFKSFAQKHPSSELWDA